MAEKYFIFKMKFFVAHLICKTKAEAKTETVRYNWSVLYIHMHRSALLLAINDTYIDQTCSLADAKCLSCAELHHQAAPMCFID